MFLGLFLSLIPLYVVRFEKDEIFHDKQSRIIY